MLNPTHKRGASKAKLLISLGYSAADCDRLEADLRAQHLIADVVEESDTAYGKSYAIVAPLNTPSGRTVVFRSIWQIETGTDYPRLITMYPE
ncbi:MAG TPA: hypothetical protein VKD71_02310 [Gemmataceae bacterium]|nr:hypothetical protein [Gemmataceae bacterium]